jgi:thiamine pyrophosphokinase
LNERLAIVLANGDLGSPQILRARLAGLRPDMVIAADGGSRHATELGLTIDRLVGDLDSLASGQQEQLSRLGTVIVQRSADKDETDLELALLDAQQQGVARAIVLGAVGGRLDMTLANVGLLLHPGLRDLSIQLWFDADTAFLLVPPGGAIPGTTGDRVSLVPLGGEAHGVTTRGLAFPLDGETLPVGPGRGISNRVVRPDPRVGLAAGALLVVLSPGTSRAPGAV